MQRGLAAHCFTPALRQVRARSASILAWGSNKKGQCGSDAEGLVLRPTETSPLHNVPTTIAAGRLHSATVLANGDVLTWGGGEAGKLGLGSTQDTYTPTRVEAFVGRTQIRSLALGHQHTLFLDKSGVIFACGENKEGQCGLGTSLETIAGQRRLAWAAGLMPHKVPTRQRTFQEAGGGSGRRPADAGQAGPTVSAAWQVDEDDEGTQVSSPFAVQQRRMEELRQAQRLWERAGPGPGARASESSLEGLMPGQLHTPARLGRDLHNPFASSGGPPPETPAAAVKLAASRFFSALIDDGQQVYSFGGDYNGALGNNAAWSPAAQRVDGEVQQALEENGGAVDIAAGSTFCLANTSSGRPVMWGGWPGARSARSCPAHRGVAVAEIMNLPAIRHIAAGHSHALFSDGERVWALGQWLSADGSRKVGPGWANGPQQVMGPVDSGIATLEAGAHCCAALSTSGQVYMWGSLVSKDQAEYLRSGGLDLSFGRQPPS
ncbi:hypothetical protein WJX73_009640 [Symbiochloris irregularis]|uniref:Ultraviolet-B receptor UVR8 n=1 Tax=Symbiochloris irregularis TaxID=706552 RepID=A0AAW1NZW9_9CHLO